MSCGSLGGVGVFSLIIREDGVIIGEVLFLNLGGSFHELFEELSGLVKVKLAGKVVLSGMHLQFLSHCSKFILLLRELSIKATILNRI